MSGDDAGRGDLRIEVVWVGQGETIEQGLLALPPGATLADALAALPTLRGGQALAEQLASGRLQAAIFGMQRNAATRLHPGDRIELLAALRVDPKLARQRRVEMRRAQALRDRQTRSR